MITHNPEGCTGGTTVLFKIISRYSWDKMQAWHKACPGSTVEHVMAAVEPRLARGEGAAA